MDDEKFWVELEITSGDSVTSYNGQIHVVDYFALESGTLDKPFIRLYNAHWYRFDGEDEWKKKELIEYGKGRYEEYADEALIRSDIILTVFRLKHGPRNPS